MHNPALRGTDPVELLKEERDFYFNKLRDIEAFLDDACSENGEHAAIAAHQIRAILYASNDVFVVS